MSEQELIQARLRGVASRLQLLAGFKFTAVVAFWTCIALLLMLAAYKLFPFPFEVVQGSFLLGGVVFVAASSLGFLRRVRLAVWTCLGLLLLLGGYWLFRFPLAVVHGAFILGAAILVGACAREVLRPLSLAAAARVADQKLLLKERLSSAVEFGNNGDEVAMAGLVLRDAAKHAETLQAKEILPLHLPPSARWVLLMLVAIVGLAFVPEYRTPQFKQQERARKDVKQEGEKITRLVTKIEQKTKPAVLADMQKEVKALSDLGEHFKKVALTKEEVFRDLNNVADMIRKKQEELGENKEMRALNRKAAAAGTEPNAQQKAQLQQKINDLQKKLGSNPPSPEQVEKMKSELKQALEKVKANPKPDTAAGQEAKEALEKAIDSAMAQAKDAGNVSDSLDKAIEAMKQADVDMVAKHVGDAVKDLEQMKEQSSALAKMQQQAAQAGKDLAEQLQKGQAQAAKETLEKFIEQMQQSNLSDKQKEQMAQELTKALDPAQDYGKVGENLEQAISQMAKNDKTGAANSMQAAAEELQRLMDQQAEGQQLSEMMDQLRKSQCQIAGGNCQGDQCKDGLCKGGQGGDKNRAGKGGGYGDWPDEGNMMVPQYSETWENDQSPRAGKDSRGVTERGDPRNADRARPTKIQGQLGEGGPMPGIQLKGVSIKGQSNVEMEHATGAAKQEAEDALNKEQIPKSYQGQVKEYFDSLK